MVFSGLDNSSTGDPSHAPSKETNSADEQGEGWQLASGNRKAKGQGGGNNTPPRVTTGRRSVSTTRRSPSGGTSSTFMELMLVCNRRSVLATVCCLLRSSSQLLRIVTYVSVFTVPTVSYSNLWSSTVLEDIFGESFFNHFIGWYWPQLMDILCLHGDEVLVYYVVCQCALL